MPILPAKFDHGTPGSVFFLSLVTEPDPELSIPGAIEQRLSYGVCLAGRVEGGKLTRRKTHRFSTAGDFWKWFYWVRHARERSWIISHRLTVDATLLEVWQRFDTGEFTFVNRHKPAKGVKSSDQAADRSGRIEGGLLLTADPPAALAFWHQSGFGIHWIDSRNWFPNGLADMAERQGLDLPAVPDDRSNLDDLHKALDSRVDCLCSAFVDLWTWLDEMVLGQFAWTVASGSVSALRSRLMEIPIDIPLDRSQKELERLGVFGGRVECFWLGDSRDPSTIAAPARQDLFERPTPRPTGPFYLLDASSFYGFCMLDCPVPVKTLQVWRDGMSGELALETLDESCLASVTIHHSTERFPVRTDQGAYFAAGHFETTLCGPELVRALRSGAVAHVSAAVRYQLDFALRDVAWELWTEAQFARATGNRTIEGVCKSMLARLSGKFGQRSQKWIDRPAMSPPHAWARWQHLHVDTGTTRQFRAISWHVQELTEGEDPPHAWPAIHGWVTSHGRETLRVWIETAGAGHCLYCSTDAVIVDQEGFDRLDQAGFLAPGCLGFLRVDTKSDWVDIRGPMDYSIGEKVVVAGQSLSGHQAAPGVWSTPRVSSLSDVLSRQGGRTVREWEQLQTQCTRATFGRTGQNGWVIPPIVGPGFLEGDGEPLIPGF